MRPRLDLEIIWEDDHMIEVSVFAGNASFSGTANCYCLRSDIEQFADTISGFPKTSEDVVSFGTSPNENVSYFSTCFRPSHHKGHFVAEVAIFHIDTFDSHQETSQVKLEFRIEAAEVDRFTLSLKTLARAAVRGHKASLYGLIDR